MLALNGGNQVEKFDLISLWRGYLGSFPKWGEHSEGNSEQCCSLKGPDFLGFCQFTGTQVSGERRHLDGQLEERWRSLHIRD